MAPAVSRASSSQVRTSRLERGEGLGHDDDEHGLRIEAADLLSHVVGVDVGDVAAVDAGVGVGLERLVDHDRAEVGAADADGHHVLDPLAGDALPLAGADLLGEGVHAVEHVAHVDDAVLVAVEHGAALGVGAAQRGVEHGAVLRGVDVRAGVHGVAALLDVELAGELDEQLHGLVGDEVLGQVDVELAHVEAELGHAVGVGGEPALEVHAGGGHLVVVLLERRPRGRAGRIDGCGNG